MPESKGDSQYDWGELAGMPEQEAEDYMLQHWGSIPDTWMQPGFRDMVLGCPGQAELNAHMNFGEQTYGGKGRLGKDAGKIWYERNISGQGHPANKNWLSKTKGKK